MRPKAGSFAILILIAMMMLGVVSFAQEQEAPPYPTGFWLFGTLECERLTKSQLDDFTVIFYNHSQEPQLAYALGRTFDNGMFLINAHSDLRLLPISSEAYYIGVISKEVSGVFYGKNQTTIEVTVEDIQRGYKDLGFLKLVSGESISTEEPEPILPGGSVPLFIQRAGSDLQITWEARVYQNPQIFILTGSGSGVYTNSVEVWTKIVEGGSILSNLPSELGKFRYSDGILTHEGQVGGGSAEVYYKAIEAQIDVTTDIGRSTFEAGWAVGKINIMMRKGWNAVSVPFFGNSFGGSDGLVGDNFGEGDTVYFWDYYNTGRQDMTAFKRFSTASGWDNPSVNFTPGKGAMFNIVSLGENDTRVVTLIGTLNKVEVLKKDIQPGWNNIGAPLPRNLKWGGFLSDNVEPKENLVVGDTISEWGRTDFTKTIRYQGNDSWSDDISFKPGVSYWFNHVTTADKFTWKVKR